MMNDNYSGYSEERAVEYIRKHLSDYINSKYSDEDIIYIIDIIWDYYDKKGFTTLNNIDEVEEDLLDYDDLMQHVKKTVVADGEMDMNPKELSLIVKNELDYEESIENIF